MNIDLVDLLQVFKLRAGRSTRSICCLRDNIAPLSGVLSWLALTV